MEYSPQKFTNNQIVNFIVEKCHRFRRHLTLFIVLLVHLYYSTIINRGHNPVNYYGLFTIFISFLAMIYINIYLLVPYFFFKSKYISYLLGLIVVVNVWLFIISYVFGNYIDPMNGIKKEVNFSKFYNGAVLSVIIVLTSTMIKLMQRWIMDNERLRALKNFALGIELRQLRNQINPHFLFNLLNNVKALIRTDPAGASDVLVKLSEFLRYQLYENDVERTLLVSEIDFLNNFINLEKIRRNDFLVDINCLIDARMLKNLFVPPNLFTTFVENAVKHGSHAAGLQVYITIEFEILNNNLSFICRNSKHDKHNLSGKKNSGLGLVNIKRRLTLLYGDNHSLKITSSGEEFIVQLVLPL